VITPPAPGGDDVRTRRQVHAAVVVEVTYGDGRGTAVDARARGRLEGDVAAAVVAAVFEQAEVVAVVVGRDQVEPAVAVEVADRHGDGVRADCDLAGGAEVAGAVALEHTDGGAAGLGRRHVEPAVAVEVAHGDRAGREVRPGAEAARRLEGDGAAQSGGAVQQHQRRAARDV